MKKIILVLSFVFLGIFAANAQYNAAIGLRGGLSSGITFKKMMGESALEFIAATRYHGINFTLLFEKQNAISAVDGLYWFYGAGAHIGYWNSATYNPWLDSDGDYVIIGVDGIIGLEYVFDAVPIGLSIDWKPAFNLVGYTGFWGDNGALSIRYTF
jgi:hypothetical protein